MKNNMKVSTELKNLIKRSFDEKRAKVAEEIKTAANNLYEDKKKEVESSKEFKAYVKACKALYDRFEYDCRESEESYGNTPYKFERDFNDFKDMEVKNVLYSNVDCYARHNDEIQTNITKEVHALNLAQESLLIKLTYEKDLDNIRAMLAEYDIEI